MKRGGVRNPKTKALARALGIEVWGAVGLLETLWEFARDFALAGDIGRFTDADIADAMFWRGDPATLVAALVDEHWLDRDETHRLVVHGWSEHADEGVHVMLARAGRCFADGTMPRLTRLTKDERARVEALYAAQNAASARISKRRKSARRAHGERTASAGQAPDERTASARRAVTSASALVGFVCARAREDEGHDENVVQCPPEPPPPPPELRGVSLLPMRIPPLAELSLAPRLRRHAEACGCANAESAWAHWHAQRWKRREDRKTWCTDWLGDFEAWMLNHGSMPCPACREIATARDRGGSTGAPRVIEDLV